MAEAIGRAGARVILVARSADLLRANVSRLEQDGVEAAWIAADLSDRAQVQALAERAVAEHGPVDILVHSAGLNLRPPRGALPVED